MKLTQDQFEKKYKIIREKLIADGISYEAIDHAEFVEIYEDEENVCSDEWLSLFEDTARTQF